MPIIIYCEQQAKNAAKQLLLKLNLEGNLHSHEWNAHVQPALKISQLLPVIKKIKSILEMIFHKKALNWQSSSYYYYNITTAALWLKLQYIIIVIGIKDMYVTLFCLDFNLPYIIAIHWRQKVENFQQIVKT